MKEESLKSSWLKSLIDVDLRIYFLSLCIVQMTLIFIQEDIIGFRADFFDLLEDVGRTGIEYVFLKTVEVIGYAFVPVKIAFNGLLIGLLVWLGTFAFGYKISYRSSLKIAILLYAVHFIPQIIKILWFGLIYTNYSQFELDSFHYFSLAAFWEAENRTGILVNYALSIDLALILYVYFMGCFLEIYLNRKLNISIWIAIVSYIGMGILWVGFKSIVFT